LNEERKKKIQEERETRNKQQNLQAASE